MSTDEGGRKIRIGILGLGRGFMLTLPALRADPRIAISGAYDLRLDARARFRAEFGTPSHDSVTSLVADPTIDAIYVATPHELHADQAVAALDAGKHVLVEKPMATSIADCLAMEGAARRNNRILIVGPSHGFDAPVRHAADLIKSGRLGAIRMITALNYTDFMYRPRRPEELDDNRGGGVVYSQAAHQIDVVRRLVGASVASVRAVSGNWDPGRPSDGAYAALMTFKDGTVATLTYSGYAHYDSDELLGWISELGQNKDSARYGDARRALSALSPGQEADAKESRTYGAAGVSPDQPAPHHEHFGFILVSCERADLRITPEAIHIYGNEARELLPLAPPTLPRADVLDEFVGAIRGDLRPVHDGRWGLETMACCAALTKSSRDGIELSPGSLIDTPFGD
jgi:phthalate 4,5-cis-dihydrodiol dehydrogenase